jgi:hypothetical protein
MDETTEMDLLDRQLREAVPYIDDDGFSQRVLKKLPARRSRLQTMRATILFSATLLASIVAYVLSDGGRFVVDGIVRMAGMSPLMIIAIAAIAGLLIMAGGVAAAVFKNSQARS